MLCIGRHSSVVGVWREALEQLPEIDLAESSVEVDFQEEVAASVTGVFCGNAHGSRRLQFVCVEGVPVERGALHLAVEKLCRRAPRFQDSHSHAKRFPAYALHIHPNQQHMTQARMEEVLLSAVASVLDQLGILKLPEGKRKRRRVCSASIAMTGVKPLPSTQVLTAPSQISLSSPAHRSQLSAGQYLPEQQQLLHEPSHASRKVHQHQSAFSFTPAVAGGRTSKPVYCRPPSINATPPRGKKRLLYSPDGTEAKAVDLHEANMGDGTSEQPPLPDMVCSTLQKTEPEIDCR